MELCSGYTWNQLTGELKKNTDAWALPQPVKLDCLGIGRFPVLQVILIYGRYWVSLFYIRGQDLWPEF